MQKVIIVFILGILINIFIFVIGSQVQQQKVDSGNGDTATEIESVPPSDSTGQDDGVVVQELVDVPKEKDVTTQTTAAATPLISCSQDQIEPFIQRTMQSASWDALFADYTLITVEPALVRTTDLRNAANEPLDICTMVLRYQSPISKTSIEKDEKEYEKILASQVFDVFNTNEVYEWKNYSYDIGPHKVVAMVADGAGSSYAAWGLETSEGLRMVEVVEQHVFETFPTQLQSGNTEPCPCSDVIEVEITVPITEELLRKISTQ